VAWARTPQSNAEIADRLNEITFGGALMAEMRAIAFVQDLIEKGAITGEFGRRLKRILVYVKSTLDIRARFL
jgi:NTE family protein